MISAVIMASGASKRMGKNKLLLPLDGKPMILHTLETVLKCGFESMVLVSCHEPVIAEGNKKNIKCIFNKNSWKGQSESIRLGVMNSPECSGYMFFTGDQPLLDNDTISALIEKFRNNQHKIIVPVFQGKNGNPVIFPAVYKNELLSLSGDMGGRNILKTHLDNVLFVEIDNRYALWDIDTPEDYRKIVELNEGSNIDE